MYSHLLIINFTGNYALKPFIRPLPNLSGAVSMDLLFCSRYPFSSEAKALMKARSSVGYGDVERAKARLLAALGKEGLKPVIVETDEVLEGEVASYAVARMILACLKNRYYAGRFAVAESKRIGRYLSGEDDAVLKRVAAEFGMALLSDSPFALAFPDYLRFAPKSIEYKLINMKLRDGKVSLGRSELVRVLEEAARMRIEELPFDVSGIPENIKRAAEEVRGRLPKEEGFGGKVFMEEGSYPPCIAKLLERMRNSENLPHTARWYLAAFLLKTGMKVEDVIAAFRTAPDFNEQITRYQVEYLAKRNYSVPSCASVDSYGLCIADCGIRHPLNYKRRVSNA